ncbi:glycosyltransferase family 2 protein [Siphonobacter sp. SORGH_AS_0500]|uniref:glycosyltransferase family 2 protein n=1 Tax=Siphonobacter sp. SORGH_AS_0500 TaxID=1864824 RepID=UPI00286799C1|nr:glycosyltransferase family 2 protein [Siphonobacter sp. SORGH_AS_0500]MDR6193338.1 glycosyltransferase involved in cell wall biosynthesis [Siphonobacter sp. SORGH_AS_0500]
MKVSIIISTFITKIRREKILELLISISQQEEVEKEVIIVNNNPNEKIENLDLQNFSKIIYRVFNINIPGLSKARNFGIKMSKGDILIFVDDDVVLDRNYIKIILEAFIATNAMCIGGKVILNEKKIPEFLTSYFLRFIVPPDYPKCLSVKNKPYYIIGSSMAFQKKVFDKYGFFNTKLGRCGENLLSGEDIEMIRRIEKSQVYIEPLAISFTSLGYNRTKKMFFIKRFFWQGITDAIIFSISPKDFYDLAEISIRNGLMKNIINKLKEAKYLELCCAISRYSGYQLKSIHLKIMSAIYG